MTRTFVKQTVLWLAEGHRYPTELTLFRPEGGGAIVPALTLDVYNFFHKQANRPNKVTFPKIYLGTIWRSKCLSIKFDVTMATTF